MFVVKNIIESEDWKGKIIKQADVNNILKQAITFSGFSDQIKLFSLNVLYTNANRMRELNSQFRHKDKSTNVLSFEYHDYIKNTFHLGDIALCYEVIKEESIKENKLFKNHLLHMLSHGILHLMGFDHQTEEEFLNMKSKEVLILNSFDIADPYKRL